MTFLKGTVCFFFCRPWAEKQAARSVSAPTHISLWHLQYMQTNILVWGIMGIWYGPGGRGKELAIGKTFTVSRGFWYKSRILWPSYYPRITLNRVDSGYSLIPIDGIWDCRSIFFSPSLTLLLAQSIFLPWGGPIMENSLYSAKW